MFKKNKKIIKTVSIVTLVIFVIAILCQDNTEKMQYNELIENVKSKNVNYISLEYDRLTAKVVLKDEPEIVREVQIPDTRNFMENIEKNIANKEFKFTVESESNVIFLIEMIPTLLILVLVLIMLKTVYKSYGVKKEFKDFSKDDKNGKNKKRITFENVAGLREEKEELQEIVNFLKEPTKYEKMGARMPKGALLLGEPGCGKTLLAQAVAGEADVPFLSLSGSDFVEMFVGVGASRVRDIFKKAKKNSPCIIFIDEIDAIGGKRSANSQDSHNEREQTLNQLLVEMDGFESHKGIIVMAATNRVDILDSALLRPGRFDRQIVVGSPDVTSREEILKLHSKDKPFEEDIDFGVVAKNTVGFSGADLENMINESILLATRKNKNVVTLEDLEEAMVKVMMGPEKKSKIISDNEKKLTAYHEAGHAVVSKFLPTHDTVHQISIIPRGRSGGYTMYKGEQDKSYNSKLEMKEHIVSLLGGRVAEELVLNDVSTGASNDIERATKIARAMVMKYGMSEKVGPINFVDAEKLYSEKTAIELDQEVKDIIIEAYDHAEKVLRDNMDKLHKVAEVLIEKEKMEAEEFEAIFNE